MRLNYEHLLRLIGKRDLSVRIFHVHIFETVLPSLDCSNDSKCFMEGLIGIVCKVFKLISAVKLICELLGFSKIDQVSVVYVTGFCRLSKFIKGRDRSCDKVTLDWSIS